MKIGTDIVEVERFADKEKSFYEKIFTQQEIQYAKKFKSYSQHFAGIFCAKEAIIKMLGVGLYEINPLEIEVSHLQTGKPIIILTGKAKNIFENQNEKNIEISISHIKNFATAVALAF